MISKRVIVWLLLPALGFGIAPSASAQDFRNISSFSLDTYFDNTFETRMETVFLAPLPSDRLLLQLKASNQVGNQLGDATSLTMVHFGPVILFSPAVYGIITYGAGFREDGTVVHEGDIQLHYESEAFRVGGGARARIEPDDDVAYVIPTIGGKVFLPRGFGVQANWYVGIDNEGEVNHSVWVEVDYAVTPVVTPKLGASVELGENPARPDGSELTYNLISGVGFQLTESVSARYQLEYIGRADRDDGIRNFVYVDWRF